MKNTPGKAFAFSIAALLLSQVALGAQPYCDVDKAYQAEANAHTTAVLSTSASMAKTLEEWQAFISSRQWKLDVPMQDQMNSTEAVRFGEISQKQAAAQLAWLYESKRERDIRVIGRMATLADKTARYGLELPHDQKSEDYLLIVILDLMRQKEPLEPDDFDKPAPASNNCSLEYALHAASLKAVAESSRVDGFDYAVNRLNQLAAKYGSPIDRKKLTPDERQEYDASLLPSVQKAMAFKQLAEDLMRLSWLEGTSKLMLASWHQDQYDAPGDMKYTGTTLDRWRKEGKATKSNERLAYVLILINEKIPSDIAKGMANIGTR